ncbi:hypothetical protein WJX74_009475 [Apatococcus lobatus]|uniref:Cilia- and flagella-associated protein 157 n=1 Tax=Apatococcus lobatus TaxID=904363 RepID=A0AAW1SCA7_9CHLO
MPPKTDVKARQTATGETEQASLGRDVIEKELVINALRQKLDRMKELGERLIEDNNELHGQLDAQQGSLKDINEYLRNELTGQQTINAALEKRVTELQGQLQESRLATQEENNQLIAQMAADETVSRGVVEELKSKVKSGQAFLEQKERLESSMKQLQDSLNSERSEFARKFSELERRMLQETEKRNRDFATRMREQREELKKMTESHLEELTKRTILENEQMSAELQYESRQVEQLVLRNQDLSNKVKLMQHEALESRGIEQEMARRNSILQNTLQNIVGHPCHPTYSLDNLTCTVTEVPTKLIGTASPI